MRVPVLQGRYRGPTGGGRRNASGGSQMQEAVAAAGRTPRQAVTQLPQSGGLGVAPGSCPSGMWPGFLATWRMARQAVVYVPCCNDAAVPVRRRDVVVV